MPNEVGEVIKPNVDKAKKKKRQRIRNRKRNKCNRILATENSSSIDPDEARDSSSISLEISKPSDEKSIKETATNSSGTTEKMQTSVSKDAASAASSNISGKTREEIIAEREAKKLAKQAKKTNPTSESANATGNDADATTPAVKPTEISVTGTIISNNNSSEKTREQIKAEREAKKQAKQAVKAAKAATGGEKAVDEITQELAEFHISSDKNGLKNVAPIPAPYEEKKKPVLTKAERRAIQEAQRAAKAQSLAEKKAPAKLSTDASKAAPKQASTKSTTNTSSDKQTSQLKSTSPVKSLPVTTKVSNCKVKLFNHLESASKDVSLFINNAHIHPSIVRLGEQYAKRTVVGSNARCIAFMNALKMLIQDFETPPKKEFTRSLEATLKLAVEHLQKCRPLAVSVSNAHKHIKHVLTQLPTDKPESELKEHLCHFIDTYIENQIGKAAEAISSSMQEKIQNGDVILTFGCSSLINYICEEAHRRHVDFRVIVVDSRPFCEGQELLRRLTAKEIPCTYVLINAVGFVMPEATKVLLGAHALLSNGYVMARTGTAQVALVANSFNVPVLVCCETHKFSERFQTDAIVYNELGNPHDLVLNDKCCLTNWQSKSKMSPLNLIYDITPPELVTAVVTEVSILPCTSVPVILRIKPAEIGYYS